MDPFDDPGFDTFDTFSNTSKVVLQLAQQVSYKHLSFNIYLNKCYTNIPLLAALRKEGIGGCGTARTSPKNFPSEILTPKGAKIDYHYRAEIVINGVATNFWMDNAPVSIMTTIYGVKGRQSEVLKPQKKPGPKSFNAAGIKKAHIYTNSKWTKLVQIPRCIDDYNQCMGGVDIADQYRLYYDTQQISNLTWYPLFYWSVNTALTDSFIIYGGIDNQKDHKIFRMEIAWELIMSSEVQSLIKRKLDFIATHTPKTIIPPSNFYLTTYRDLPLPHSGGMHFPVHLEGCKECILCRWKQRTDEGGRNGISAKTVWGCATCMQPLCLSDKKNCFPEFYERGGE